MRPREEAKGQNDLFRSRLDQIIDMGHELVRFGGLINWQRLDETFGEVYADGPGQPPLPTRLMAGASILKHTFNLSDEELARRWVENPYFQHFCGMEFFCHKAPFDPSSLSRWRSRMGSERLEALLQESLSVAVDVKAIDVRDLSKMIVDTTVQEKAITFPTDAKLTNRAREKLVKLAKKYGLKLRQGYPRVGKLALMKHQRYAHAKQFKRAGRELRRLRTYLGRVIRDIERQIKDKPALNVIFRPMLFLGSGPNSNESARSPAEAKEASGRSAGHAGHIQAKNAQHISSRLATLRAARVCPPGALRSLGNQPDFRHSRACQTDKPGLSWNYCY